MLNRLLPVSFASVCRFRPETIEKREKEIKVVRAGKKYLLYPENILEMFASVNLDKFREAITAVKGYCLNNTRRRYYCGAERNDEPVFKT